MGAATTGASGFSLQANRNGESAMSRPRLPRASRKNRIIIFRVSEAEFLQLAQKAAAANLRVNDLVRELALSPFARVRIETVKAIDPALLKRLDRLGNNLNQIAMRGHLTGRVSPRVEELCEMIGEIVVEAAERTWSE